MNESDPRSNFPYILNRLLIFSVIFTFPMVLQELLRLVIISFILVIFIIIYYYYLLFIIISRVILKGEIRSQLV